MDSTTPELFAEFRAGQFGYIRLVINTGPTRYESLSSKQNLGGGRAGSTSAAQPVHRRGDLFKEPFAAARIASRSRRYLAESGGASSVSKVIPITSFTRALRTTGRCLPRPRTRCVSTTLRSKNGLAPPASSSRTPVPDKLTLTSDFATPATARRCGADAAGRPLRSATVTSPNART